MSDETFSTSNASLKIWLPLMTLGLTKICTNQWWLLRWVSSLNLICRSKPINLFFLTLTHYSSYMSPWTYMLPLRNVSVRERHGVIWPGQCCLRAQLFQIAHIFGKQTLIKHCVFPQQIAIHEAFKKGLC